MQSASWEMPGLDEAQAGIKIAGRNINNLRYVDDTTRRAETEEHSVFSQNSVGILKWIWYLFFANPTIILSNFFFKIIFNWKIIYL